jgi:HK97 family phage portal protein
VSENAQPMLSAVAGPADDFWYMPTTRKTAAGVSVTEWNALCYAPVWAATNVYTSCGSLPLNLIRREDKSPLKIKESSVVRCLKYKANREMESGNFLRLMWQWQVNWGNADAEIVRNDWTGEIAELIPLEPWRTTLRRNKRTGDLEWVYREESGEERTLTQDRVFHVANTITHDGLVGRGNISVARETIGLGKATEQYGSGYFGGDGVPQLIIKTQGVMQPEARRSFHDEWENLYGGGAGAKRKRVALLQGGAEPFPIQINAEDAQFVESREANARDVAMWYGLPPRMLGLSATGPSEDDFILFLKVRGYAYFAAWEGAINSQLLTEDEADEYQAKYNLNALLAGDSNARANLHRTLFQIAAKNRNEIRDNEDLPRVDGGDTFLVQGAMVALDEDGEPKSDFAGNTPGAPKSVDPNGGTPDPDTKAIAAAVRKAIHNDLTRAASREAKVAMDSAKHPSEFVGKVDAFFDQQAAWISGQLSPHFEALSQCGVPMNATQFATQWCMDGKEAVLSASGSATATTLESSVRSAVESSTWLDRPRQALLSLEK